MKPLIYLVYVVYILGSVLVCNCLISLAAQNDIILDVKATGNKTSVQLDTAEYTADTGSIRVTNKQENLVEEIHSSFEEVADIKQEVKNNGILESVATLGLYRQHANIATEISDSGQEAVIYTLVGSELPTREADNTSTMGPVDIPLVLSDALPHNESQYIVRAESQQPSSVSSNQESEGVEMAKEEKENNDTVPAVQSVTESPPTQQEDIPSFSEWAQKQLEEAEKRKGDNMTGGGTGAPVALKARHNKNYASIDCGAKVVGYNPEANSASAVLSSSRDEYLLNTCNARIWFIIELCEAIQPKKIEIANFELFSSSPRDFSVWLSDRYPTRDWALAGRFTAQDERTIQAFNLSHTAHFGRYVKVDINSHYGQEHYCPISLFRVYGTSEIEVLDTVDEEVHQSGVDDDDDDLLVGEGGDVPKNLFGSARDAVLSIVKKAAEVLVKTPEESEGRNYTGSIVENTTLHADFFCTTPSHLLVYVNCSDDDYNKMYELVSCRRLNLEGVLRSNFTRQTMMNSDYCTGRGLDLRLGAPYPARQQPAGQPRPIEYLQALLPDHTLAALCNLIAVEQKKVVLNMSQDINKTLSQDLDEPTPVLPDVVLESGLVDIQTVEEVTATQPPYGTLPSVPLIRPSRTQPMDEIVPVEGESVNKTLEEEVNSVHVEPTVDDNSSYVSLPVSEPSAVEDSGSLDSLFSELEQAVVPSPRVPPAVQKESVFVRLANRIKALERNMSLSSQYLEELSRRYKKQVEEMQRALNAAVEERRRGEEREGLRLEQLSQLTQQVDTLSAVVEDLLAERDSWQHKATLMGQHGVIVLVEVLVFAVVLYVSRWLPEVEVSSRKFSVVWPRKDATGVTRRKSVDEVLTTAQPKKRRPSEEALVIAGNTHRELLISDAKRKTSKGETRRQRRKRKREIALQSEEEEIKPSLLDTNITESVAGWWEEDVYRPDLPPPREDVVAAAPKFVQTAVAQRQDRLARSVSDAKHKDNNTILPIKKPGPFKKIVKKFF